MRGRSSRGLAGLILFALLALSGSSLADSGKEPVNASSARRDLVAIPFEFGAAVRAADLPITWLDTSFIIAEWTPAEQRAAARASIHFEVIRRDASTIPAIRVIELDAGSEPPEGWQAEVLFRSGRKWVLETPTESVTPREEPLHHSVRVPRESRPMPPMAPRVSYDCGYNPLIDGILTQATTDRWMSWIAMISGVQPVLIDGQEHSILTRHSSTMFLGAPFARGFDFLLQQVDQWNYGSSMVEVDPYFGEGETWKNLILTIPGQTSPDEIVLMTGHFDSKSEMSAMLAPGADDNGSGSSTLLEAARLLRQLRFARTIKLIWFTGEEDGLLGSEAYLADHSSSDFLGVINVDMMGYDGDDDRCFEIHAGTMPQSQDVGDCYAESLVSYGANMPHDYLTVGATDRSDHASFWQEGVGAVSIAENFFDDDLPGGCVDRDRNPHYHRTEDTIDKLDPLFGSDIARTGLATLAAMAIPIDACFDEKPQLAAAPGVASVDLEWTPVAGAPTYRVYRSTGGCLGQWFAATETTDTSWTDAEAQLPLTYSYRVEAVDADGFCVSAASNCAAALPIVYHASPTDSAWVDICAGGGVGSGDGIIDPGEAVILPVTLVNDGTAAITGISGSMFTLTPGFSILDPGASWPNLDVQESAQSLPNHFGAQVDTGVPCGAVGSAGINLFYSEGSNATNLSLPVGAPAPFFLFDEDFADGIPPDWEFVDGGSGGGAAATWTADNPGGRAPDPPFDAAFAIVDSDEAGSGASQDEQLISPELDASVCDTLTLTFSNQFREYSAGLHEIADVDVSTDGGQSWTNVLRIQGDHDGYPDPNTKIVDLTAAVAPDPSRVHVRFRYHDGSFEWWWIIDNVTVECARNVCTPCGTILAPPGEPGVSPQLLLDLDDGGDLVLQWGAPDAACGTVDYAVYRGDLSILLSQGYDHATPLTCAAGATSLAVQSNSPGLGPADYFLVVADNGTHEGSYGRDSDGRERPESSAACRPAQNVLHCVP